FADGDSGQDVQELIKDLGRGLRRALGKSPADEIGARSVETAGCSTFRHRPQSANREGNSEDPQIVVIDAIPQACVADLAKPLKAISAAGDPIRHNQSRENN